MPISQLIRKHGVKKAVMLLNYQMHQACMRQIRMRRAQKEHKSNENQTQPERVDEQPAPALEAGKVAEQPAPALEAGKPKANSRKRRRTHHRIVRDSDTDSDSEHAVQPTGAVNVGAARDGRHSKCRRIARHGSQKSDKGQTPLKPLALMLSVPSIRKLMKSVDGVSRVYTDAAESLRYEAVEWLSRVVNHSMSLCENESRTRINSRNVKFVLRSLTASSL